MHHPTEPRGEFLAEIVRHPVDLLGGGIRHRGGRATGIDTDTQMAGRSQHVGFAGRAGRPRAKRAADDQDNEPYCSKPGARRLGRRERPTL